MLEMFMAGFLGVVVGSILVSALFYLGYHKERQYAQEAADKMIKILSGEGKSTKTGSVLSLFKNDDKNKPLN
jgi:hypothetical protein